MANKKRLFQVAERIKEIIANSLLRVADPRFSLVTVTAVMMTPDLRLAKVYWIVSDRDEPQDELARSERIADVAEAFESATGLFKRALGKDLGLRFVPHLKFFYDDTFDTVDEVERLFQKIKNTGSAGA